MPETDSHSKTFLGVRFVLFGFDPLRETEVLPLPPCLVSLLLIERKKCNGLIFSFWAVVQVKSKLVSGGGVDAVQYSGNCTHVIVDKIVHVSN